jgi:putative MFS transporter
LGEITLSQRLTLLLDASPLNGIQRWLWVLSTGGTLLDGFAIFVLGVAMPLIIAEFRFNPDVVGLIGASLVLGAVFGAGLGGLMANHLGRKPLMLADMIIICAGAAFGVFVLPIVKGTFGVPAVLGMMAAVSVLGLVVTLVFGREDTG